MKRIFVAGLVALTSLAFGASTVPVSLLNSTGSSAGQVVTSTGSGVAPTWQTPSLSTLTGVVPVANGGTGSTTAAAARTALGVPSTGANTFSGAQVTAYGSPVDYLNDTSGAGVADVRFQSNAVTRWGIQKTPSNNFNVQRYDSSGALVDNPLSLSTSTGVATFTQRPVFGSATPWDSANLASPVQTTGATFTGSITPSQTAGIVGTTTSNNANAGAVGEYISSNIPAASSVALTSGTTANITSISLTAGDWDVWGIVGTNPAGTTTQVGTIGAISTTSATVPTSPNSGAYVGLPFSTSAGTFITAPVGMMRLSLASTTTVYLVINSNFSTSTNSAYGFIAARRRR